MEKGNLASILQINLDPDSGQPLHIQIYNQIKEAVLDGDLKPGTLLPATRVFASQWGVSRNTVISAYDLLRSEDYLTSVGGSGTRVNDLQFQDRAEFSERGTRPDQTEQFIGKTSKLAKSFEKPQSLDRHHLPGTRAFRPGLPEISEFPYMFWNRILSRFWRNPPVELLIGGDLKGYLPLREEIARYLNAVRGVRCHSEQIFITSGAQQALDLIARAIIDPGDRVWLEDPGYSGLSSAINASGGMAAYIRLDQEGIDINEGMTVAPDAIMAAVTPSHQYPLGITMSLSRRLELLDWASSNNAWILEDDFDSEYRYSGKPVSALQGLDRSGRVIYVGTFSKVMFPALRLGYVIVPESLVDVIANIRLAIDDHPSISIQPALSTFFSDGHFNSHIRKMRKLYKERQDRLVSLVDTHLAGLLEVGPSEAGMHLVAQITSGARFDDSELSREAASSGLVVPPISKYFQNVERIERPTDKVLLGYAGLGEQEMVSSVLKLSEIASGLADN